MKKQKLELYTHIPLDCVTIIASFLPAKDFFALCYTCKEYYFEVIQKYKDPFFTKNTTFTISTEIFPIKPPNFVRKIIIESALGLDYLREKFCFPNLQSVIYKCSRCGKKKYDKYSEIRHVQKYRRGERGKLVGHSKWNCKILCCKCAECCNILCDYDFFFVRKK
jgi:5-methylcytosine-specific restriction endonuclease McrA